MSKERGGAIDIIPIHFDVPGHQLPLTTFVRTSEETAAIVRNFNSELFGNKLHFELLVLPPEEGSFLTRLGLVILGGFGLVWTFAESDIGKAFIRGLTDHEPEYWAEMAGKSAKPLLTDAHDSEAPPPSHELLCEPAIVSELTQAFLKKSQPELETVGLSTVKFREAYEAKNAFYDACKATKGLRAIGFSEDPTFPISRDDFSRLQAVLPPREEEPEHPWLVDTTTLRVTSPNWDREDRSRAWKGRDPQGRDRYFRIEDEEFWHRVAEGAISTHVIDLMKVQWAFQGKTDQPKSCRVLRVLEFNGFELAAALDDNALSAALGKLEKITSDQASLFD